MPQFFKNCLFCCVEKGNAFNINHFPVPRASWDRLGTAWDMGQSSYRVNIAAVGFTGIMG